jgi:malate dehydrogenase (oxaloacetate-decarboxylating)(NADP+)
MQDSRTTIVKRGIELLIDPALNRSTGFTEAEQKALGLLGLVPDTTESIETQLSRVLEQLKHKATGRRAVCLRG